MAERHARRKCEAQESKLAAIEKKLLDMCTMDNGTGPSASVLSRLLATVRAQYALSEDLHDRLEEVVEDDELEALHAHHTGLFTRHQEVCEAAEAILEERQQQGSTLGVQQGTADREMKYAVAQRDSICNRVNDTVARVQGAISRGLESHVAVKVQVDELDLVRELMETVSVHTHRMKDIKPEDGEAFLQTDTQRRREVERSVSELRDTLAGVTASLAPPASAAPAFRGNNNMMLLERMPLPEFTGKRRDYPSFRRDWKDSVHSSISPELEVRYIKKKTPAAVEPDLKNLRTMEEVWKVLDSKYGGEMDLARELIYGLQQFKYSRAARTEGEQFRELSREWTKVYSDLEEVGKLSALDHEPTLGNIAGMLPSLESRNGYVKLRIRLQAEDKELSELNIMREFMREESQRQEHLERLNVFGAARPPVQSGGAIQAGGARKAPNSEARASVSHSNMLEAPSACPACKGQHSFTGRDGKKLLYKSRLGVCPVFLNLSVSDRAAMVEAAGGCALCLSWTGDHKRDGCTEMKGGKPHELCNISTGGVTCGRKHSPLLHGSDARYCNWIQLNTVAGVEDAPTDEDVSAGESATTLTQVQTVTLGGDVKEGVVFWDTGSNLNLVTASLAQRAGWSGKVVKLRLQTTGREADVWETKVYWVPVVDTEGETHLLLAYEMEVITAPLGPVDVSNALAEFPGISYDQVRRPEGAVDLLIGIHHAGIFPHVADLKRHRAGHLRLLTSKFGTGFLLDGVHKEIKAGKLMQSPDSHAKAHALLLGQTRISNRVNKLPSFTFSECEEMGVTQPRRCGACLSCRKCTPGAQQITRREQEELVLIEEGMRLDEVSNEITFHYPLIKDPALLSDNRGQAIAMATGLERKLMKQGKTEAYNEEIDGFIKRGVFRLLSDEEMSAWTGPKNYISHHGVAKPQATTSLRVVSNSSLNNNNSGFSYNDLQAKGPNSLVSLIETQMRWRSYEHCSVWDLSKAYNTIKTFDEELHMRRLVWRGGDVTAEWKTYGIDRMHYGDRCAAAGLECAKKLVADAGREIDPEAAEMIAKGYVDDCTGGGSTETVDRLTGEETWKDGKPHYDGTVSRILKLGSFGVKVMVRDGETRPEVINLLGGGVLGLDWQPGFDVIVMHMGVNVSPKKGGVHLGPELTEASVGSLDTMVLTRRWVVSIVQSIYDPLGLLAPLTLKLKLLLQKLSCVDIGWDEPLDKTLTGQAREALKEIVKVRDVTFPRSVKPAGAETGWELAGWWDGGEPASAACLYTRHKLIEPREDGQTHELRLLAGKARVTPSAKGPELPRRSTPRTELRGLLMLSRVVTECLPAFAADPPVRISLMGDSECTIAAVECEDGVLQTWFGNRVSEIIEHMRGWEKSNPGIVVDKLHHWPGPRNIADIATKGRASIQDVDENSEWQLGPLEARFPRTSWPASRDFRRKVPEEEVRTKAYTACASSGMVQSGLDEKKMPDLFRRIDEMLGRTNSLSKAQASVARWLCASFSGVRADAERVPSVSYLAKADRLLFLVGGRETDRAVKAGELSPADGWARA
jgi:hypothetical protein